MPCPIRFGTRAEDHHAGPVAAPHLVRRAALPARVVVGRLGLELGGACVDRLERALQARLGVLAARQRGDLGHEPGVDAGPLADLAPRRGRAGWPRRSARSGRARASRGGAMRSPSKLGSTSSSRERIAFTNACLKVRPIDIASPTDCIEVCSTPLGAGELLEGEARPLDHHVVDRRLEGGRRLARDVVVDLLQRVAHRQPGGDLGDREAGGLRRERGRARHARVHLDHDDLVGRAG